MLEKTLGSPLESQEIQPVNPKGNQPWLFFGRTDAEAEIPILWPPDVKNGLTRKDPDSGKDWRWEQKGLTEDDMVGWHHWLDGREFEQARELVMDREAWRATVYEVTGSRIQLNIAFILGHAFFHTLSNWDGSCNILHIKDLEVNLFK